MSIGGLLLIAVGSIETEGVIDKSSQREIIQCTFSMLSPFSTELLLNLFAFLFRWCLALFHFKQKINGLFLFLFRFLLRLLFHHIS
jgi:hypothetical protein